MKAIVRYRYGSADVVEFRDVAQPVAGEGEVLIAVHAAGVDAGVWHLMAGLPYLVRVMGFGVRRPKDPSLGREVAGRVEAVGPGVTEFAPGDAVLGTAEGSFAEYAVARADQLVHLPEGLSFEQAAVLPISGVTALQGLRGVVQPGHRVLIIGAGGGVGSYAVQLASAYGAHVTGVCGTDKLDFVSDLGAHAVIDYTRNDFTRQAETYDVILDAAGNRPLHRLRRALTPDGTLVLVGGDGGGRWTGGFGRQILRAPVLSLFTRQTLRGLTSTENAADLKELVDLVQTGKVRPVIGATYSLAEAPEAIRVLAAGHSRGKAVINVVVGA